ncbi:MAG: GYD domain-containing protein [Paracoccaceae bacterium]
MARFIVTGNYTAEAMKGMVARPSDRAAAVTKLLKSAGAKLEAIYFTTGEHDFLFIATGDIDKVIPGLMVAGATGAVCNLSTAQAFTSDEFTAFQKSAGEMAKAYKAPN